MGREGSATVKFVFVIFVCLNLIIDNVESRVLTPTSDRVSFLTTTRILILKLF
jgi:hypothetical protein